MKHYVYMTDGAKIYFYARTENGETVWSPIPDEAHDFPTKWVPAEPHEVMPGRTEKYVNLGKVFAQENGARYCIGDPAALAALHTAGPRIGQRVRVRGARYDGFVYGAGYVSEYTKILPHGLTHVVKLDNPPASGAPDEFGTVYTTDKDILSRHVCPARELEVLDAPA